LHCNPVPELPTARRAQPEQRGGRFLAPFGTAKGGKRLETKGVTTRAKIRGCTQVGLKNRDRITWKRGGGGCHLEGHTTSVFKKSRFWWGEPGGDVQFCKKEAASSGGFRGKGLRWKSKRAQELNLFAWASLSGGGMWIYLGGNFHKGGRKIHTANPRRGGD